MAIVQFADSRVVSNPSKKACPHATMVLCAASSPSGYLTCTEEEPQSWHVPEGVIYLSIHLIK